MTNELLFNKYKAAVKKSEITKDAKQLIALSALQKTFNMLAVSQETPWFGFGKKTSCRGVYLYGAVGTGKTYLLDLFYQALPQKNKIRIHFYHFMKMVHDKMNALKGKKNPLTIIAKEIASTSRIICFDEFFVENVVDAMLLAGLLEALYTQGVILIMTSNIEPDRLYENGLQRPRFLPAIDLIKENNEVVHVDNHIDYRLDKFDYDRAFYYPEDPEMKEMLLSHFKSLAQTPIEYNKKIVIEDRNIQTLYLAKKVAWFGFEALCGLPRSQLDYIAIAAKYPKVFMSSLRQINRRENDLIINFIRLIDVFYDAKIKLIISSSVDIKNIYPEGQHTFEFERAQSRLIEMQSKDYLS